MAGFYPPFSRRNMGQRSILRTLAGNTQTVRRICMRAFTESSECLELPRSNYFLSGFRLERHLKSRKFGIA